MKTSEPRKLPASVNLKALLAKPPTPLDFVLPGFVRATVGALVSPGGVGKSYWSLAVAVAIGAGVKGDLTGLKPVDGRVVVLSKEDPIEVLEQRMHAMAKELPKGVSYSNVDYRSCVGMDIDVMDEGWFEQLCLVSKNARLVILDTLTRFHKLDENSAQDMGALLAQLERLATASGAAVLFLHHTSKASALNGQATMQQAARGSSVLVDNARWSAYLTVMSELELRQFEVAPSERQNYVRWNVSKQNYGPALQDIWYRRNDGGVLVPVKLSPRKQAPANTVAAIQNEAGTVPAADESNPIIPSANGAFGGKW